MTSRNRKKGIVQIRAMAQITPHIFLTSWMFLWFWAQTGFSTTKQRSREMAASRKPLTNMLRKKMEEWMRQKVVPSVQVLPWAMYRVKKGSEEVASRSETARFRIQMLMMERRTWKPTTATMRRFSTMPIVEKMPWRVMVKTFKEWDPTGWLDTLWLLFSVILDERFLVVVLGGCSSDDVLHS